MSEKYNNQYGQFGNYLRYWRKTKDISQEHLAHELNCSVKHISFLENGRTQPSQLFIVRLAETLSLSKIDTNDLLISAGYRAERGFLENNSDEKEFLDASLALLLKNIGASPALIRDRFGDIKMMNKACVILWREWLGDIMDSPEMMNTYRLFFGREAWRPYIQGWEQIAVILLMTLHQERLLSPDKKADALIEELTQMGGIPKDWEKLYSGHTKRSSFHISVQNAQTGDKVDTLVCTNTIGNLSQSISASLSLEVHCQINGEPPYSANDIAKMQNIDHPLLPY